MEYLPMIGQLFLSLSILILLHEFGHYFPAVWFKTKVDKFYLFFDVPVGEWRGSIFKHKRGDTQWGIGWLPLGGYCKIAGMIDESMDKEQMEGPPQPWEFRSKPTWQRLIIMLGGVIVNFALGFLIYGLVMWQYGSEFIPNKNVEHGIVADSIGQLMGFQEGDKVVKIGDKPFNVFDPGMIKSELLLNDVREIEVLRDGKPKTFTVSEDVVQVIGQNKYQRAELIAPRVPYVISRFSPDSRGQQAGLQVGDKIYSYNGERAEYFHEFYKKASKKTSSSDIMLGVVRGADSLMFSFATGETGKIGAYTVGIKTERKEYTLAEALPAGYRKGINFLGAQIKGFGQLFSGKLKWSESLGGFGTFTKLFPDEWGNWERFWNTTALISLILAFMNLLPIPALDGGHVMFLLYEMITGRKPSERFMEISTLIGFAIVLGLVLVANGLDIYRGWFQ